jgi:hypothetical protein
MAGIQDQYTYNLIQQSQENTNNKRVKIGVDFINPEQNKQDANSNTEA